MLNNIRFFKDVATLMSGTVLAQMIAIFAYPLLSRLYSPTEMGIFAYFFGICALLSILFTGRYELAIVLPKLDKDSDNVAALSIFLASMSCIASFLVIFIFGDHIIGLSKNTHLATWIYCIPIWVFVMSFCQTMEYVGTRFRAYQKLAIKSVLQQLTYVGFALLFGILAYKNNGLIISRMLSFICTLIIIVWMFFDKIQAIAKNMSIKRMWDNALCYKQFLICNVSYSFLGTFSKEFIVFSFVAFGHAESAGLYVFARSVLLAPTAFLSTTLGQAFYKESSTIIGTPKLEQLVLQLINSIIIFGVPGAVFFMIWSCEIFSFCFGEIWRDAGIYAVIFMPAALLSLFTSWPERLYEVTQKQHISLTIQVIFDSLSIFLLWFFLMVGVDVLNCILFYTILNCMFHVVYLINIFKISNFDLSKLMDSGGKVLTLTLLSFFTFYFSCFMFTSLLAQFTCGMTLLLCYYSFITYFNVKPSRYFNLKFLLIQ